MVRNVVLKECGCASWIVAELIAIKVEAKTLENGFEFLDWLPFGSPYSGE